MQKEQEETLLITESSLTNNQASATKTTSSMVKQLVTTKSTSFVDVTTPTIQMESNSTVTDLSNILTTVSTTIMMDYTTSSEYENSGDYYDYVAPIALPLVAVNLTLIAEQRSKCFAYCNDHSTSCFELENETFCSACMHNTQGRQCNICNPGYFRDKSKNINDIDACQKVVLNDN